MSSTRPKPSEFLGLHDPYGASPIRSVVPRAPAAPMLDKEKRSELVRAGAMLSALFIIIAVVITALG